MINKLLPTMTKMALMKRMVDPFTPLFIRSYNKIVITDDGSTVVALHNRQEEFPYELSRPIPEEKIESKAVLRMENYDEVKRVFKELSPEMARKQLSTLTLTTEHRWFPRARDKKAKKTEMNRPYL